MKYELIITKHQPSGGGKSPTESKIESVVTDDPVAYTQKRNPDVKLEVSYPEKGVTKIEFAAGDDYLQTYEFSEDD